MFRKQIAGILLFVFMVVLAGCGGSGSSNGNTSPETPPLKKVAFVCYASDEGYTSLLNQNSFQATTIKREQFDSTDFSKFDLIIIDSDSGECPWASDPNSADSIDKAKKVIDTHKPMIAMGVWGLVFFSRTDTAPTLRSGWSLINNSDVKVVDPSDPIWTGIDTSGEGIVKIYNSTPQKRPCLLYTASGVTKYGQEPEDPRYFTLAREDRFFVWCFGTDSNSASTSATASDLTNAGRKLFINVVRSMVP